VLQPRRKDRSSPCVHNELELDDCRLAASEVGDMYLKADKSGSRISPDALAI
jgi:hypothetical protein